MNLIKLAWRSLIGRWTGSLLSILLLTFGVAGILLLLNLEKQLNERMERNIKGINLVLGAPGSPLQLILSAVYHVDAPTGNISAPKADFLVRNPLIEKAMPLAYGDNYNGFRIVGCTAVYLDHFEVTMAEGRRFESDLEVVVGASAAVKSGLKLGDTFFSAHGYDDSQDVHTDRTFTVVGIAQPNGSVTDQLILCSVPSVWIVHPGKEGEEQKREYTAVLLTQRNPTAMVTLPEMAKLNGMQMAMPSIEMNRLTENFGLGKSVLQNIAIGLITLSLISIFISLLSSLKDRKYELAIMRTMGAGRLRLFLLVQLEGLILATFGFVAGFALSKVGAWLFARMLEGKFRYTLDFLKINTFEVVAFGATLAVGLAASLLPAYRASAADISGTLNNE